MFIVYTSNNYAICINYGYLHTYVGVNCDAQNGVALQPVDGYLVMYVLATGDIVTSATILDASLSDAALVGIIKCKFEERCITSNATLTNNTSRRHMIGIGDNLPHGRDFDTHGSDSGFLENEATVRFYTGSDSGSFENGITMWINTGCTKGSTGLLCGV